MVGPTRAPEGTKEVVVGFVAKKMLHRCLIQYDPRWSTIIQKCGGEVGFIPKFQGHTCMGEKGNSNFHNVLMLTLRNTILLMGVRI
jgi:hypothetical protein